jgi:hypothetical protein
VPSAAIKSDLVDPFVDPSALIKADQSMEAPRSTLNQALGVGTPSPEVWKRTQDAVQHRDKGAGLLVRSLLRKQTRASHAQPRQRKASVRTKARFKQRQVSRQPGQRPAFNDPEAEAGGPPWP